MSDSLKPGSHERDDNTQYYDRFIETGFRYDEQVRLKKKNNIHIITLREKEVLELISNGDSSKIIAGKLNISETTAITHRKNLIQKLHVKNTAQLIKVAVLAKIIA